MSTSKLRRLLRILRQVIILPAQGLFWCLDHHKQRRDAT